MNSRSAIWTRRSFLIAATLGFSALPLQIARAAARPQTSVWKDPNCGCCTGWVQHLRASGFEVFVTDTAHMQAVKKSLGVPDALASCHTASVAGYTIEGHVPASAIDRLLAERPRARGLSVPGMPSGSPGMEGGHADIYDVVLFGEGRPVLFQRYQGNQPM